MLRYFKRIPVLVNCSLALPCGPHVVDAGESWGWWWGARLPGRGSLALDLSHSASREPRTSKSVASHQFPVLQFPQPSGSSVTGVPQQRQSHGGFFAGDKDAFLSVFILKAHTVPWAPVCIHSPDLGTTFLWGAACDPLTQCALLQLWLEWTQLAVKPLDFFLWVPNCVAHRDAPSNCLWQWVRV